MKHRFYLSLFLVTFLSCASVDQRISENQAAFDSLPPKDRILIRSGEIAAGFTEAEVLLAKGEPHSKDTRYKGDHEIVMWTYTKPTINSAPNAPGSESLAAPYGYPIPGQPIQTQPMVTGEVTVLVVEFEDGHVKEWHEPEP